MFATFICKSLPHVKKAIKASIFSELYHFQNYPPSNLFLRCISSIPIHEDNPFAVSYLINSLGFSQETAIKLTSMKYLQFETPEKPDLVLKFFENYGFSNTQVSSIIRRCPQVLLSNPENTLLPKFEFLCSKGLTKPDLIKLISSSPNMLKRSLEKYIIPSYNFFKTMLGSDEKVFIAFKSSHWIWGTDFQSCAEPNIAILREYGVHTSNIAYLLMWYPKALMTSCDEFRGIVEEVKALGIHPLQLQFVKAVRVKSVMQKSNWENKLNLYRKWGWSDKEILTAFSKHPLCMLYSQNKITATMDYFVNKMGWESSTIARYPLILSCSLENRIVPRCSVFEALLSKGLIEKDICLTSLLVPTETVFLQRYVTCYEVEAPQLLKLYQEKLASRCASEIKQSCSSFWMSTF